MPIPTPGVSPTSAPTPSCNAAFDADPVTGFEPLTVQFTDKSTGNPTSWSWDFGDGGSSKEQNPKHTFQTDTDREFTVTLSIEGQCGSDKATKTIFVRKSTIVAEFDATPKIGIVPFDVRFTSLSKGNPTSFAWAFGDGATSTEEDPVHVYVGEVGDTFSVGLIVQNLDGLDELRKKSFFAISTEGNNSVASLTVTPETAKKSFGSFEAIVTALDKDGNPVPGANITAAARGSRADVRPSSTNTDTSGQARFMFRFGLITNNGKIIFTAGGVSTTVTQE